MTPEPAGPSEAGLTSNEKSLAISVLVVNGLIALVVLFTVLGAAYALATGSVFGAELSRSFTQMMPQGKDPHMKQMMDAQLAAQTAAQVRMAPYQVASEGLYLVTLLGSIAGAVGLLRGGGSGRTRLGQFAIGAIAARVAVGVVTYVFTSAVAKASTDAMMAQMQENRGNLTPEQMDQFQGMMKGLVAGATALSSVCMTVLICAYFGVVAYVFLKKRSAAA